jgi:hypothetical protein
MDLKMSNISTAYDAIKSKMDALFPSSSGYIQLVNPYDIEENTDSALRLGWGISFGSATNTRRELSIERTINITFTRARFRSEFNTSQQETNEKLLFEDQYLLIKDLEKEPTINNAVSGIAKFSFDSDGGVESVTGESDAYIKLVTVFSLEYFENLYP